MKLSDNGMAISGTSAHALAAKGQTPAGNRVLRHSRWDALLVGLAVLQGAGLLLAPSVPLVALGLWWNANTVSHNFIHLPFFRSRAGNRWFSIFLSLLLGLPQSFWKARHLAHHRGRRFRWTPLRREWMAEGALVFLLWAGLALFAPRFLLTTYLPGWLLGLGLCELHGRLEHARGTVSYYGRLYNWLFFNDGYHVEHHARPARHWTTLPNAREASARHVSRWPAVLRWLELAGLDGLEELVCRSRRLQRFVLRTHERALARVLSMIPRPGRIVIVGGGMFPRTALALRRLVPEANLTVMDAREDRLECAKGWLNNEVQCVNAFCTAASLSQLAGDADLVVVPLALRGHRVEFYRHPPARNVLVHDWLWRPRGQSVVISWCLLKRLNLVSGNSTHEPPGSAGAPRFRDPRRGPKTVGAPHQPGSADIPVRAFTGHSCPVSVKPNWTLPPCRLATGKPPEPADRNVCATPTPVQGLNVRNLVSGNSPSVERRGKEK
jgi:fatty acid desaturase